MLCSAVLCCAVLCCAVLCCAVLYCAVLCSAALHCAVLCCAVLCCAVLYSAVLYSAVLCAEFFLFLFKQSLLSFLFRLYHPPGYTLPHSFLIYFTHTPYLPIFCLPLPSLLHPSSIPSFLHFLLDVFHCIIFMCIPPLTRCPFLHLPQGPVPI